MKQIKVNVPEENSGDAEDVLKDYSSDIYSVQGKRNEQDIIIFHATVESEDLDDITSELKSIKDIDLGDLVIRIFEEESLIEKGQKTKGSTTSLSQEEIYSKSQEFSKFSNPQWALIGLSSAIASYGLILDNIAVVIGAMMLAPILSPLISGAISLKIGDKTLLRNSFFTTGVAVFATILVSGFSVLPFTPGITPVMNLIVSAEIPNMILSLFVGSAAVLAFATGSRSQISGVAVAIALVPPLAATGVGLRIQDFLFASKAFSIALVNLLSVLVAGTVTLKALGVKPSTYYQKKTAENLSYIFPISVAVMLIAMAFLLVNSL